jgi:hypothetical protein
MPFELGLTVGMADADHAWIVCETRRHRVSKPLSDLDGTDVYIHNGTAHGCFASFATRSSEIGGILACCR